MCNVAAKSFCRLRRSSKQTYQTWAGFLVALIQDLEGDELHLLVWMAMHRLECMQCTHSCVLENQTKNCRVLVNRPAVVQHSMEGTSAQTAQQAG